MRVCVSARARFGIWAIGGVVRGIAYITIGWLLSEAGLKPCLFLSRAIEWRNNLFKMLIKDRKIMTVSILRYFYLSKPGDER